jgi:hypothetical protein
MFTNLLQPKKFLSAGLKTTDIPYSPFYFTLQSESIKTQTENLPFQKLQAEGIQDTCFTISTTTLKVGQRH